jgi:DNA-directed RNA polymerase subunit RPC12/RpoP
MANFYCEYCGQKGFHQYQILPPIVDPDILMVSCKGKHKLMKEVKKSKYTCKYCGQSFSSLTNLTGNSCIRQS